MSTQTPNAGTHTSSSLVEAALMLDALESHPAGQRMLVDWSEVQNGEAIDQLLNEGATPTEALLIANAPLIAKAYAALRKQLGQPNA